MYEEENNKLHSKSQTVSSDTTLDSAVTGGDIDYLPPQEVPVVEDNLYHLLLQLNQVLCH